MNDAVTVGSSNKVGSGSVSSDCEARNLNITTPTSIVAMIKNNRMKIYTRRMGTLRYSRRFHRSGGIEYHSGGFPVHEKLFFTITLQYFGSSALYVEKKD